MRNEIRRIDMIIENIQVTEQNPDGMTYISHPFGGNKNAECIHSERCTVILIRLKSDFVTDFFPESEFFSSFNPDKIIVS